MKKFLKTIRFDPSDTHVFENAAVSDEWAIPGGFLFAGDTEDTLSGKRKQAFNNGFLSLAQFGHSTFVSVAEIADETLDTLSGGLAQFFVTQMNAPSQEMALRAAKQELDFVCDMCQQVPINSVFAMRRFFDDEGQIREEFSIVDAPGAKPHARVWEVVED